MNCRLTQISWIFLNYQQCGFGKYFLLCKVQRNTSPNCPNRLQGSEGKMQKCHENYAMLYMYEVEILH